MQQDAIGVLQLTFQSLLAQMFSFLPELLGAIIILIIGLIVAWALRVVVEKIVSAIRVDMLLKRTGVTDMAKKVGFNLHVGMLFGWIVKWFVIILALIAAADVLGWSQITQFLNDVVLYIPSAFIAAVILLMGVVLGSFVYDIVMTAVKASKLGGAHLLAGISKWAVFVFAFIAAMEQLGIAPALLQTLTMGLVGMLAIAGGLAFGLGGQEHAKAFLKKLGEDIGHK
ncbi:hypothetical protein COV06_01545 [Candidatus Uhrbacteria bacterium CG10_big_fil_rev_8_21_14_0_10_50_16]|uniref:Small-conductance mechanosensitive ion channel n=1 Tax=Candidatus Uhrbacteria bacterium CG10_big_fil_rev_8_21_14_0_10_50_16 TaxID=1975039 RepID=A0A2H0RNI5_9BACT|nr:MAG: hypothetical protein COV06_01545 [Candidatus Uhrbacteria bacterium CG10_big_fil_rev_8_21_14_0_10_50_16]